MPPGKVLPPHRTYFASMPGHPVPAGQLMSTRGQNVPRPTGTSHTNADRAAYTYYLPPGCQAGAGRRYYQKTGRRVTFEYALMAGINDSPKIAKELSSLLQGNGSHVNLIPINPTAGDFKRPSQESVLEFEQILSSAGVNCTVRVEKGTEISAACGQLRTDIDNLTK